MRRRWNHEVSPQGVVYEHREETFGDNVDTSEVGNILIWIDVSTFGAWSLYNLEKPK